MIRPKSIAAFRGELDRAAAIGAEYLVLHPGNYRGRSVDEGIAAFVLGLKDAAEGFSARGGIPSCAGSRSFWKLPSTSPGTTGATSKR